MQVKHLAKIGIGVLVLEEVVLWLAELVSEQELPSSFPAINKLFFSGELAVNNFYGVSALR